MPVVTLVRKAIGFWPLAIGERQRFPLASEFCLWPIAGQAGLSIGLFFGFSPMANG
jgi:hypothetical protein